LSDRFIASVLVVDEGTSLASGNWSTVSRNQFLMLLSLVKLGEEVRVRVKYISETHSILKTALQA
jgi:hypothetical protein